MKLVERLKEPYKKKLELANQSYPSITGAIFTELEEKSFYTELTYGAWIYIQKFTDANHPADIFKQ